MFLIHYETDDGGDSIRSGRKRYEVFEAVGCHPAHNFAIQNRNVTLHGAIRYSITSPGFVEVFI